MVAILINSQQPLISVIKLLKDQDKISSTWSLKKTSPGVSEEKPFKGMDRRKKDGKWIYTF